MPIKQLTHIQQAKRDGTFRDPRPNASVRGYDTHWQALRLSILRDEPCCRFCDRPATIVDHIRPISAGGVRLMRRNPRPLCRRCHDAVTANYIATGVNEMPKCQPVKGLG